MPATNTVVKPARKREPKRSKLLASATTDRARLRFETQLIDGSVDKTQEEDMMKPSTEDRAGGALHEAKGKVKEEIGKATNDPDLQVSGNAEKNAGKVQKWIGNAEKVVGE